MPAAAASKMTIPRYVGFGSLYPSSVRAEDICVHLLSGIRHPEEASLENSIQLR